MGNYENLKQSITEVIRTNGNQEITGAVLQSTLLTIISTVGANATFAGIATPATNPGTPDGPVFYLASEGGTYTNFGTIELQDGLSVLMWNGSWSSQQIFGIDNEPTAGSDNLVKSGGVAEELALGAVYDVSAKNPTAGVNNDGKFESLSALLSDANLNILIPTAVRKGGMSIKFVHSSVNKYVQYRLMSTSFSANEVDWEEVGGIVTTVFNSKDFTNFKGNNRGFIYIPISVKEGDSFSLMFDTEETSQFTAFSAFLITDKVSDTPDNSQSIISIPFPNTEYSIIVNSDNYKYLCIWLAESSNIYGKNLKVLYKGNNDTSILLNSVSNLSDDVEKNNLRLFKETFNNKSLDLSSAGFIYIPISVKSGDTFSLMFDTEENAQFTSFTSILITGETSDTSYNSQTVISTPFPNTEYSVVVNSDDYKYLGIWLSESSNMYGKNLKVLYKTSDTIAKTIEDIHKLQNNEKEVAVNNFYKFFKGNNRGFLYIPVSPKKGETFSFGIYTQEVLQATAISVFLIDEETANSKYNSQNIASSPQTGEEYTITVDSEKYRYLGIWISNSSNVYNTSVTIKAKYVSYVVEPSSFNKEEYEDNLLQAQNDERRQILSIKKWKNFEKANFFLTIDDTNEYLPQVLVECKKMGLPLGMATIPSNLHNTYTYTDCDGNKLTLCSKPIVGKNYSVELDKVSYTKILFYCGINSKCLGKRIKATLTVNDNTQSIDFTPIIGLNYIDLSVELDSSAKIKFIINEIEGINLGNILNECFVALTPFETASNNTTKEAWEIVQEGVDAGGEVISHEGPVIRINSTEDDWLYNFRDAKQKLQSYGWEVNGIILAGGDNYLANSDVGEGYCEKYYLYSDLYGNKPPYILTKEESVTVGRFWFGDYNSIDAVKTKIDEFISNKKLVICAMHGINDSQKMEYIDNVSAILAYIQSKVRAGECIYKTWKDIFKDNFEL